MLRLCVPDMALVPSYLAALREGDYRPMQLSFGKIAADDLATDPAGYIDLLHRAPPFTVTLDGHDYTVTEHEILWIADGDRFLGAVALRYRADPVVIDELAGHVGMAVRPSLVGRGYGPRAIMRLGKVIRDRFLAHGISRILATCHPDNVSSRRLITFAGGRLIRSKDEAFGYGPWIQFEICL